VDARCVVEAWRARHDVEVVPIHHRPPQNLSQAPRADELGDGFRQLGEIGGISPRLAERAQAARPDSGPIGRRFLALAEGVAEVRSISVYDRSNAGDDVSGDLVVDLQAASDLTATQHGVQAAWSSIGKNVPHPRHHLAISELAPYRGLRSEKCHRSRTSTLVDQHGSPDTRR
jgi:hypothetical protein